MGGGPDPNFAGLDRGFADNAGLAEFSLQQLQTDYGMRFLTLGGHAHQQHNLYSMPFDRH